MSKEEKQELLGSIEIKMDNLDARNMRQLNQMYAEIKKIEGIYFLTNCAALIV